MFFGFVCRFRPSSDILAGFPSSSSSVLLQKETGRPPVERWAAVCGWMIVFFDACLNTSPYIKVFGSAFFKKGRKKVFDERSKSKRNNDAFFLGTLVMCCNYP